MLINNPEKCFDKEKKNLLDSYIVDSFTNGKASSYGYLHEKEIKMDIPELEQISKIKIRNYLVSEGFETEVAETLSEYVIFKLPE